jgi:hypothetical protein
MAHRACRGIAFFVAGVAGIQLHAGIARAEVAVGAGLMANTFGRDVVALYGAASAGNFGVSAFSGGVATSVYYQSAYELSFSYLVRPGRLLWGPIMVGLGFGAYLAKERYAPPGMIAGNHFDYTLGPDFSITWKFLGPMFVTVDALFGLRNVWSNFVLAPQDIVNGAVGVRL